MNKELSAIETMCEAFDDPKASTLRSFLVTVVCKDGQKIPNIEAHLQLEESRGAIRPPASENLDLLLARVKTLRRSPDESWEILNPCMAGEYLEFDIRKIQVDYDPPYFPIQKP